MRIGDRVEHERFGSGTVVGLRLGMRARVRFDATPLPRTILRRELSVVAVREAVRVAASAAQGEPARSVSLAPRVSSRRKSESPPAPVLSPEDRADLRQTMEALRLGVVPARFVKDYTVARDAELAAIETLLDANRGLRIVWGDYGHGKTHLLDVVERMALERNFITARIVLDPSEIRPTHPKRLYRAVTAAMRYPTGGAGLDPLMHALCNQPSHREPDGSRMSRFFSPYLYALHHGYEEVAGWMRDYINGDHINGTDLTQVLRRAGYRGPSTLTLSDFRTYGRVYMNLLGTLAVWAADAGYEGLVLLFDEVERVDALSSEQRYYAFEVLKHVAAVVVPDDLLPFDPGDNRDLYRGGHAVHRDLPLRFRPDQPLSVVFALTPLEDIRQVLTRIVVDDCFDIFLTPLRRRDVHLLVGRIADLYTRAYPGFSLPAGGTKKLIEEADELSDQGADAVRDVVRGCVLQLDSMRLGHGEE